MIVMNLKLDNMYGFCDFDINFSYPKKIIGSTIPNETLKRKNNFRYKKINVIMGQNASGKTTFGLALMKIFNFIVKNDISSLEKTINNKKEAGYFSIDFLVDENYLYRVSYKFYNIEEDDESPSIDKNILEVYSSKINKNDSYESARSKLKPITNNEQSIDINSLRNLFKGKMGWMFRLTNGSEDFEFNFKDHTLDLVVLEKVLQSLDPDIISVDKLNIEDSYVINKKTHSIIIQNGKIIDENKLSSGTKAGINIANVISSVMLRRYGFYFCDEKFSFIHSDLEQAVLSLLIEKLGDNEQLFITSHNAELLDMDLPKHAFTFFKKQKCIDIVYPSDYLKKNNSSLSMAVKNDLFNIAPDLEKIYEIGELTHEE